jgi:hypothetical protein
MSYDMIDRFLRNNLDDDDYAKYSDALNALCTPQRTWVGLTDERIFEIANEHQDWDRNLIRVRSFARAIEAKLKEKNT